MYEYRLAFEFWGSLTLATVLIPLTVAVVRQMVDVFHGFRHDEPSAPLSSVPSHPRP